MDELFVLVHSPLVGPTTWQLVAEKLAETGHQAIVPSLLPALAKGRPYSREFGIRVAQEVTRVGRERPLFLVAHSAAGAYLPVIRAAFSQVVAGYIFVDARLPKDGATLFDDLPDDLVEFLHTAVRSGHLPPWSEWFGPEAMAEILPDATIRNRFLAELPTIPLALFTEPIPVFSGWPDAPCSYLHLSGAYEPQVKAVQGAGWPVLEMAAAHLHMLVEPRAVAAAILQLAERML